MTFITIFLLPSLQNFHCQHKKLPINIIATFPWRAIKCSNYLHYNPSFTSITNLQLLSLKTSQYLHYHLHFTTNFPIPALQSCLYLYYSHPITFITTLPLSSLQNISLPNITRII